VLIRLNQIMRGWANYYKHAVCKHTLNNLAHFAWWRVIRWLKTLHRWSWKDLRRAFTTPQGAVDTDHGRRDRAARPANGAGYPVPLPGRHDPQPLEPQPPLTAETVQSPIPEDGYAGSGQRPGETGQEQSGYRAPGRLNLAADMAQQRLVGVAVDVGT